MTHILITSGGTTVPIDPVRQISNNSSGRFGAAIASEALKAGHQVSYLTSSHGQSPFAHTVDFHAAPDWEMEAAKLKQLHAFAEQYRGQYHEYRYQTFYDYAEQLQSLATTQQPQIIILAAAVSDYLVANYSTEKVRSNNDLHIDLKPAPKLIHHIREWSPKSFVVGFKLLVNASDADLVTAAKNSINQHNLDLCVANDSASLQRGAHEIIIVARDGSTHPYQQNLASAVISECLQRVKP